MGGLGEEHSVMKLVLGQNNWYSVPPMPFPRVQEIMMMTMTMISSVKNEQLVLRAPHVLPKSAGDYDDSDDDHK